MKETIVILHGWGSLVTGENRFGTVKKLLELKGYRVFTPDLPGFGSNLLRKDALYFEDYVFFVKNFIEKNKLKNVVLIGHSFGGRVAIRFTSLYSKMVGKLILVSASGIPHTLSLKKKTVYIFTKILRPIFAFRPFSPLYIFFRKLIYRYIGEMDYYTADNLQTTFKNIYQESIIGDLPKIIIPTLIIWGEKDTMTPVDDGKLMHKMITKSKFIIVKNAKHKFPYERPEQFAIYITDFLQNDTY